MCPSQIKNYNTMFYVEARHLVFELLCVCVLIEKEV